MYRQILDPIADSLLLSALCAVVPLIVLFVLLGAFRVKAYWSALAAVASAVLLAIVGWQMPAVQAFSGVAEGAFYGLFPILWILINALFVYRLTEITGWFAVLRRTFNSVSDDQRIQAILIAFCFGALIEALAGFGTPVAISVVMLIAAGLKPIKAATVALVANTAPVAFGSLAVPITTLAGVTGLPVDELGAMAGRQTPVLAVFVPLILVLLVDGKRGVRQTWPAAIVAGLAFGISQFVWAQWVSVETTDIAAGAVTLVALLGFLRIWRPRTLVTAATKEAESGKGSDAGEADEENPELDADAGEADRHRARTGEGSAWLAFAPYLIIIVLFAIAQFGPVKQWLAVNGTHAFAWPGLDVYPATGDKPVGLTTFKLDHIKAAGTILLLSGLLTMACYKIRPGRALRAYGGNLVKLRWTMVTVMLVLALSYTMNLSGMTATLGEALAATGPAFAFLSPILGWIGVALTGSDTSSNSLFGNTQVAAAQKLGLDPVLLAAANSSGGVLGKMISIQNLSVAAAAIGQPGSESQIFRKVIGWSLGLIVVFAFFVYLQSTPVLGWMTKAL
ncbi:L-lactate permease [Streptomyces sp. CAU 1734]|uniref:L-lactate permease n=1 Tax=Streptomyces sp. CAU 1734 TaxID=3140360 RepID=UPI0032604D8D